MRNKRLNAMLWSKELHQVWNFWKQSCTGTYYLDNEYGAEPPLDWNPGSATN